MYLNDIRCSWINDGTLQELIGRDGLRGVTSSPAIYQKAIADSTDYEAVTLHARPGDAATVTYEIW